MRTENELEGKTMNNKRTTPMAQPRRAYGISTMQHPNRHGFLRDTEPRPLTEDERIELEYTEMEKERNDFLRRLSYYKKLPH